MEAEAIRARKEGTAVNRKAMGVAAALLAACSEVVLLAEVRIDFRQ